MMWNGSHASGVASHAPGAATWPSLDGCEHLLLNVLGDEDGVAAQVLARHGVTLEFARRRTAEICDAGDPKVVGHSLSPRANVVVHLADIEAERLEHGEPTDAHLILAMLTEGAGVPNGLFRDCGVATDRLREDLLDALTRAAYLRQRRATERRQRAARTPRQTDAG